MKKTKLVQIINEFVVNGTDPILPSIVPTILFPTLSMMQVQMRVNQMLVQQVIVGIHENW